MQLIPTGKTGLKAVLLNILKNPLILACLIGILLNITRIGLPFGINEFSAILGRAALAMGLLSVGAGLRWQSLGTQAHYLLVSGFFKLLLLPGLGLLLCICFEIAGLPRHIVVLYSALPCSVSAYTLAAQLGGDKELIAATITVQTLMAALTMPGLLYLVTYFS